MKPQEYFNSIQSYFGSFTITDLNSTNEYTITRPEWQAEVEAEFERKEVDYFDMQGAAIHLLWFNVKWIYVIGHDETENEALCEAINDIEQ